METQEVLNAVTFENSRDAWNYGKMLGSLYTFSRELFRRRQWKPEVMVSSYFFEVKFPELVDSTSYVPS